MPPPLPADPEAFARPSFEALYAVARSYLPEALRLLKVPPDDVDDLIHDIVIIAHRGLDHYEPRAAPGGEPADAARMLRAWLSGIAWRQVTKRRRLAYRRFEMAEGDRRELRRHTPDKTPSSEQIAAEAERRRILMRLLQQIPAERAEVLIMHTFLEMSAPDIAAELGLNENTVKSRIARGRADVLAATKRLEPDERSVLEGTPLLLPLALEDWSPPGGGAPPIATRALSPRLLAGMLGMMLLGMIFDEALRGLGRHAPEDPPIAAAPDTPAATVASVAAPPSIFGTPPATIVSSTSAASAQGGTTGTTVAREMVLIAAARHALARHEYAEATSRLDEHERELPQGTMVGAREQLRGEVARARAGARR